MKASLAPGDTITKQIEIDEARCISFMGPENAVYATPRMVSDMEYTCRDLLLRHLDEGEDSVGAHVSIDHLAATPMGMKVTIDAKIIEVDRRRVTFEVVARDSIEECGRAKHVRFIVEREKSKERIAAA
jgi:fluoroacetyl-CoA thioesterase